jgi:hypothetical protein
VTISESTFGNEAHLPRVPVPTLAESCERFLEWSAPLLTDSQRAETEAAVAAFLAEDSPAHALQARLERYDQQPGVHSWLDDFWAYRYLGRRDRIALNANFFFLFHDSGEEQVERAAALVTGTVDYKLRLDAEEIPPVTLRGKARAAAESFAEYAAATATTTLSFPDFGANTAKRLGMSPDAFVQMAYQLAHRRAKGLTGATYESIATRQFRHGRTEAMRVVTPEVLTFVSTMDSSDDPVERRAAFRAAAAKHVARAKECQAGAAPEQHLWELQRLAGGTEPHALYRSPGWLVMRDDYLSTSSAPSANIQYFGFGSTSPQCIGIAYVLLPETLNIYLSTPRHVADQMRAFARELTVAMRELRELLDEE